MVEQLTRNEQVGGSSPLVGSFLPGLLTEGAAQEEELTRAVDPGENDPSLHLA
jgi:hypothetical protein